MGAGLVYICPMVFPLKFVDLGRCTAVDFLAASDVPALTTDDAPIAIHGLIDEDSLMIGINRLWELSLTHLPRGFTRTRMTTAGGMMYCRNMSVWRLWAPSYMATAFELQALLTNAAVDALLTCTDGALDIDYDAKYALLRGQKFAGGSYNIINDKHVGLMMINVGPIDFDAVRPLFKIKKLMQVCDLAEFALGPGYVQEMARIVADAGDCELLPWEWNAEEREHLARITAAHRDPQWVEDTAQMDLFDCTYILEVDGPQVTDRGR